MGWVLLLVCFNASCDQVTKNLVRDRVVYQEEISLISHNLIITKVENTGAFLSLGADWDPRLKQLLLLYLPALAMCMVLGAVLLLGTKVQDRMLLGICCMLGGGLGNLIDRWRYGSVTDFLHLDLPIFRTGIFNLADVSIMLGAALVIWTTLRRPPMPQA